MRLDKYLSELGIASRSACKDMIRKGAVTVNGSSKVKPEMHVSEEDVIRVEGRIIHMQEFEYYLLHKPAGYVTAREDASHAVVMSLIPSKRKDLSPVGRLDEDTEGVLLITNDGLLNHKLLRPENHVAKEYFVKVDKPLPENAKEILENPIELKDFTTKGGIYEPIDETSAYLTITEGKFHQVKRMFWTLGCTVEYLKRVSFGPLTLGDLPVGQARALTEEEIQALRAAAEE